MKVLMFRPQWIDPIRLGRKVQTVRPPRKRPMIVGDALSLRVWESRPYASKQMLLLNTHCTAVHDCEIDDGGVVIDQMRLTVEASERFALRDGFGQFEEMRLFFRQMHGLPFKGSAISWD